MEQISSSYTKMNLGSYTQSSFLTILFLIPQAIVNNSAK